MVKLHSSIRIDAPAAQVWARLAQLEDIQLRSDAVVSARCAGAQSRGVGAERNCDLVGNRTITERWVAWDVGRAFQCEGFGLPRVKRAVNRWFLIPHDVQTLTATRRRWSSKEAHLPASWGSRWPR